MCPLPETEADLRQARPAHEALVEHRQDDQTEYQRDAVGPREVGEAQAGGKLGIDQGGYRGRGEDQCEYVPEGNGRGGADDQDGSRLDGIVPA